jgi:hypothetical protein
VRERSNVGERVQTPIFENLIARNLQKLEPVPAWPRAGGGSTNARSSCRCARA